MANTKSKKTWIIIGSSLLVLIGLLFTAKKMEWIGKEDPTEVEMGMVKTNSITEIVSASGKIQPEVEVKLAPDVSGEIVELLVKEGDSVKTGQKLLRIRPDNYESILARAKAQLNSTKANYEQSKALLAQSTARLEKAKNDFERNKKLYSEKVISKSDFDQFNSAYNVALQDLESSKANVNAALYNVKSSEAALKEAQTNLTKTTIYAPQSGIISKLNVELGERVVGTTQMAGTEMLRIANLNNMEVRVNVNENDITRVKLGDSVSIDVDAFSQLDRKFKGVVYEIASSSNNTGSTTVSTDAVTEFEVKIRILRSSYADLIKGKLSYPLKPGMSASVEIKTKTKEGILTLPISAVTTRDANEGKEIDEEKQDSEETKVESETPTKPLGANVQEVVFIEKDGKAKKLVVKTGISDFENIEITEGLKKGDKVIVGPYATVSKKLKEGDPVKTKKEGDKKTKE